MSDIDTYLAQLRAHLTDLDPKRAEEIVAEARTHVESRLQQLRASDMESGEATAEALRAFGEPARVAHDLLESNAAHRRPVALRAVAALALSLGSSLALSVVLSSAYFVERVVTGTIMPLTGLGLTTTMIAISYALSVFVALLTGIVAGRRFWWIAAAPPVVSAGFLLLVRLFFSGPSVAVGWGFGIRLLVMTPLSAAAFAGVGWLGAHLPARRPLFIALKALCVTVVVLLWLGVASTWGNLSAGSLWLYLGLSIVCLVPVLALFLVAGRRDGWLSRDALIAVVSTVCALGLLFAIGTALIFAGEGPGALRYAQPWLTIAALTCGLGLLAALIYWRRTQPEPSPRP